MRAEPIVRQVDVTLLRWPGTAGAAELGAGSNRLFEDLSRTTWAEVDDAIALESEYLDRLDRAEAEGTEDPDAVADEAFDEMAANELGLLDLGVAAVTLALNAAGCPTLTSCSGHGSSDPQVVFWSQRAHLDLLMAAAEPANVGVTNASGEGALIVYAHSCLAMLLFARELRRRRAAFRGVLGLHGRRHERPSSGR